MFKSIKLEKENTLEKRFDKAKRTLCSCLSAGLFGAFVCFSWQLYFVNASSSLGNSFLLCFYLYSCMIYYICLFGILLEHAKSKLLGSKLLFVLVGAFGILAAFSIIKVFKNVHFALEYGIISSLHAANNLFFHICIDLLSLFANCFVCCKMHRFTRDLRRRKYEKYSNFNDEKQSLI